MRLRNRNQHSRRRGGVLLFSLITAGVVAVLATCLLQLAGASMRRQASALEIKRSFYAAEAGLAEAYGGLRVGKTGNVGSSAMPARLGEGLFWVTARDLDASRVQLDSTGMVGLGRAVLSLVAERGETSVASLGMFSDGSLAIPPGVQIVGYDSELGAPIEPPPVAPAPAPGTPLPLVARLGSNQSIQVDASKGSPTVIYGDLGHGPSGQTVVGSDATHVGEIAGREESAELPEVELPQQPGTNVVSPRSGKTLVLTPEDRAIGAIHVGAGAQVIVQGPARVVVNQLTVGANGHLEFDTQMGPIALYVAGEAQLQAGSTVSTTSTDPSRLLVQGANGADIGLLGQGALYGVVYTPAGEVTVGPTTPVYGAVVAQSLVVQPGAKLYFDRHLDDVAFELALPRMLSWRVVEMSSASNVSEGHDPFQILGVDRNSLPSPAAAHADQPIHVSYENLVGTPMVYDGPESGMDWTNVRAVTDLKRDGKDVVERKTETGVAPVVAPTAVMDAITAVPALDLRVLTNLLLNSSPLSSGELAAAISQTGLSGSQLAQVLVKNAPLGSPELQAMLDRPLALGAAEQAAVLVASSPLPVDVLARVIGGTTNLTILQVTDILLRQ